MYKLLLPFFFMAFCVTGQAQRAAGDLKVVKVPFDSTIMAPIIPDSIFTVQADVLHLVRPLDTTEHQEKYGYEIWWPATFIDGYLFLTITRRQIILRSGHDNPNPNHLYWFVNITDEQYRIIESKINADKRLFKTESSEYSRYRHLYYHRFKPEKDLPRAWTDKKLARHEKDFLDKKYRNTNDLIAFFDEGLTAGNIIPFVTREAFDKLKPVRIAYTESEYVDQVPFIKPKEIP